MISDNNGPFIDAAGNPIGEAADSPAGGEPIDSSGPAEGTYDQQTRPTLVTEREPHILSSS